MQILPFLSKKGVDVYDHEDLQEASVDLGVITAEQSMWTRDPAFATPAMLIALWKRMKDLEEAVKVLQEVSKTTSLRDQEGRGSMVLQTQNKDTLELLEPVAGARAYTVECQRWWTGDGQRWRG